MFDVLAQTTSDPTLTAGLSGILTAMNLGLAGIGLLAFVRGWIVPGKTYDDAIRRAERAEDELAEVRKSFDTEIVPEMSRARTVIQQLGRLTERVMDYVEKHPE